MTEHFTGAAPAPGTLDVAAGRRAFLRTAGLAGVAMLAGTAAAGAVDARPGPEPVAPFPDADILNFALNLEYLEAEFYLRAVSGRGLASRDVNGRGSVGRVTGGRKVDFDTRAVRLYAEEIAADEQAHVRFLRAGLGGERVARPRIDFAQSFTAAARAAGLVGANQRFDAFANETNFLLAAFIFEDVGVTAYKGAARFIENKDILEAAAGILAVEAYHAGEVRTLLFQRGLQMQARAISDLRDKADGKGGRDEGIGTRSRANIVPADRNAIAYSRTPDQVLDVVYLGGNGGGGFFPKGITGPLP